MKKLPEGEYWKYLRKSRADIELEAKGEGETLAKHDRALTRLAKEHNILVTEVFKEIESGESLYYRTEILRLLDLLEKRKPKGVLVMDLDRLGRGNMQEQGMILSAFKNNNVLIITPRKIYDLNDEFDEEYSEFEAFMARKELKIITRRLQGGRVRSVQEGNYIGTRPPYGYLIKKEGKSRFLVPHPVQAEAVKMIFDLYTSGKMGSGKIAQELNKYPQFQTYTGKPWEPSTVLGIIKNEVYAGKVQWKKKEQKKSKVPGKRRDTRTRPKDEWITVEGKHEPLISQETFEKAHEILGRRYHVPYHIGISNPLAGIVKCGKCGYSMVLRPYPTQEAHIMCYNTRNCHNKSSKFSYVENAILKGLEDWLKAYKAEWKKRKPKNEIIDLSSAKEQALNHLVKELSELESQVGRLHDLLERGIYDDETYLERSRVLNERIEDAKERIKQAEQDLVQERNRQKAQKEVIPHVESVLKFYRKTDDSAKKNELLKSVIDKAEYTKEKHQRLDQFQLVLYPVLPQIKR